MTRAQGWRWFLVTLVVMPLALIAAYLVQEAVLQRRLVAEANAVLGAPHPRPVHVVPALPRTFGEALAPYLPAIEEAGKAFSGDEKAAGALRAILRIQERPATRCGGQVRFSCPSSGTPDAAFVR